MCDDIHSAVFNAHVSHYHVDSHSEIFTQPLNEMSIHFYFPKKVEWTESGYLDPDQVDIQNIQNNEEQTSASQTYPEGAAFLDSQQSSYSPNQNHRINQHVKGVEDSQLFPANEHAGTRYNTTHTDQYEGTGLNQMSFFDSYSQNQINQSDSGSYSIDISIQNQVSQLISDPSQRDYLDENSHLNSIFSSQILDIPAEIELNSEKKESTTIPVTKKQIRKRSKIPIIKNNDIVDPKKRSSKKTKEAGQEEQIEVKLQFHNNIKNYLKSGAQYLIDNSQKFFENDAEGLQEYRKYVKDSKKINKQDMFNFLHNFKVEEGEETEKLHSYIQMRGSTSVRSKEDPILRMYNYISESLPMDFTEEQFYARKNQLTEFNTLNRRLLFSFFKFEYPKILFDKKVEKTSQLFTINYIESVMLNPSLLA